MRAQSRVVAVLAVALALTGTVLAGCGGSGTPRSQGRSSPSPTPAPTVVVASPGSDGVQQVTIEAAQTKFVPPRVEARTGTLRVTLRNLDPIAHDVVVPAANTGTGRIDGDDSRSVTFTLATPGSYQFLCSYHQGAGMQGVLELR